MKRKAHGTRKAARKITHLPPSGEDLEEIAGLAGEAVIRPDASPALTGADLDADWPRAHLSGEAVGGSVATPDQDVVDGIGHALGVEQAPDAEVRSSEEILRDRDRLRWHLEREAADDADAVDEGRKRPPGRRRGRRSV